MSARRILRAFDRQPAGRFEIDQRVLPGRSQVFLPSLGYSGVLYGGSGGSPIVTLQNANAPFTQAHVRGGRAHVYRPNSTTSAGESYKWQTPDFDIGANGSMFWYGYRDTDSFSVALEYGGANWGLTLENTGTQVKASYVDNPTTAAFTATLTQASSTSEPIAIGLIKNGATVTVVCRGASASTSGGNGGIRRSAGSGFGVEYQIGQAYSAAFLAGVTSEALSVSAMQALLDNPWSVFRANSRTYFIPSAGGGATTIEAALESISLATFGATVGSARAVAAALESLSLTTSAARVSSDRAITASVEAISITTSPARIASDRAVAAATEQLTVTPATASVALASGIAAGTEALSVTANPATVALAASIAATLEAITVTGLTATVQAGSDSNISAALESITVTVNPAMVARDSALAAALESLTVTPHAASIAVGQIVAAALESLTLTSYPAGVALNVTLGTQLEQINLATFAAQVGLGTNVAALTEALTLTPHGATITFAPSVGAQTEHITLTTFAAVVGATEAALLSPGLEFTIPLSRLGYTIPLSRVHFTIPQE